MIAGFIKGESEVSVLHLPNDGAKGKRHTSQDSCYGSIVTQLELILEMLAFPWSV
jgi:hypothetical protein